MTREFSVATMTKQDAIDMGLMNVDRWYGAETEFVVNKLSEMIGIPDSMCDPMIYVVTTKNAYLGAAVLAHANIFEQLATEFDSDLVILPSSIHEILILKDGDATGIDLTELINSVNGECVDYDIRLGDRPLYYKRGSYKVTCNKVDRSEAIDIMAQVFNSIS